MMNIPDNFKRFPGRNFEMVDLTPNQGGRTRTVYRARATKVEVERRREGLAQ
jgi:hypothetical protein